MLPRDLIFTGLTRDKNLVVFVGTRKAMAVKNRDTCQRQTFLEKFLRTQTVVWFIPAPSLIAFMFYS